MNTKKEKIKKKEEVKVTFADLEKQTNEYLKK
jgi:hypothetical protein